MPAWSWRHRVSMCVAAVALAAATSCGDVLRQPLRVVVDDADLQVSARSPEDPTDRRNVSASYFAFLPSELPMRPGDKAFFRVRSRGEPHAIALGTMVDAAVRAVEGLGSEATLEQIEALPEMTAVPSVFPLQAPPSGAPQVNGSAAEPCYLERGAPPSSLTGGAPRCEQRSRPAFDGRQSFYNTGWLGRDASFTLSVADDTEPGTYAMMCLIHRSQMRGTLEILEKGAALPNVGDYDEAGNRAAERIGNELAEPAAHAAFVAKADDAVAGAGTPGVAGQLTTFGRKVYDVPVGGSVSWSVYGMHTITFDAPDGDNDLLERRDGRVRLNRSVWRATGSPPLPPEAQSLRASPGQPVVVDGGSFDGRGPYHSGVLRSLGSVAYRLTFPKAGTYSYACLIHPVMAGKVRVG